MGNKSSSQSSSRSPQRDEAAAVPKKSKGSRWNCAAGRKGQAGKTSSKKSFIWERAVLDQHITSCKHLSRVVSHALIIGLDDHVVRAALPPGFTPHQQGVKDVVSALHGDVTGLLSRGVCLGPEVQTFSPGKMDDEQSAIYCSDGQDGGCVVWKTTTCALVVVYTAEPEVVVRMTSEVAAQMIKLGH